MHEIALQIENLQKKYRLGVIGGGTLSHDIQNWWAAKTGKEHPNRIVGQENPDNCQDKEFWALNGINFSVNKGEAVGIIGSNGAGKSTLLKILSRVTAPTFGEVKINGRIASMLEVGTGFHGELTGRENIYMNGAILGMSRREVDKKIDQIIEFSECKEFIDTPVKRYSSGMYVKLAFAVAAHLDAEILVMDEVLAVGDMKFQKKCLSKMSDVAQNEGRTVLYVSHNMDTIRQLCNRCVVLDKGKVIFDGDVESAIRVYLGGDKQELVTLFDLENEKRPSTYHGSLFKVNSFEFLDKEAPIYFTNETVKYQIKWSSFRKLEELRISFTIKDADDGRTVGMTQSDIFANPEENIEGVTNLSFDISNIVEGNYYFEIDIFILNEFGNFSSYDHPLKKIYFEIVKDIELISVTWEKKYWGNVRLNTMKVL